jgi:hypothetical protein
MLLVHYLVEQGALAAQLHLLHTIELSGFEAQNLELEIYWEASAAS